MLTIEHKATGEQDHVYCLNALDNWFRCEIKNTKSKISDYYFFVKTRNNSYTLNVNRQFDKHSQLAQLTHWWSKKEKLNDSIVRVSPV